MPKNATESEAVGHVSLRFSPQLTYSDDNSCNSTSVETITDPIIAVVMAGTSSWCIRNATTYMGYSGTYHPAQTTWIHTRSDKVRSVGDGRVFIMGCCGVL